MTRASTVESAIVALWNYHCVYDELRPCDVVIGLGSYDLRVADRCAEIFRLGLAQTVLFTGGTGNWTKNLYPGSEAAEFALRAIAGGVPESVIVIEEQATNIGENIELSAKLLPRVRSAILVTKPQTQRRCAATASKKWPDTVCMVTAPMTALEDQPIGPIHLRDLICEMVGDLRRLEIYPGLGYQSDVFIPTDVLHANTLLIEAGFIDHLP